MFNKLSIVIPVFNEENNVEILFNQLINILNKIKLKYEIIFIDDGSYDSTFNRLIKLKQKNDKLKVIQFRKNYGKSAALNIGFKYSSGDVIITMDGDLQDDPDEIPNFLKKIENYDLVVGWKFRRKDPLTKKIPSKFFNILTKLLTGLKIHDFNCGFKAFRKECVKNLPIYGELYRYIPALIFFRGFEVSELKIKHRKRIYGKSKYGTSRIFKGFLDLITLKFITTYHQRPLHFFGILGIISLTLGLIITFYLVYLAFIIGENIVRPLLFLAVLFAILSIQFISLGFFAELIARYNSREDDTYVIKKII